MFRASITLLFIILAHMGNSQGMHQLGLSGGMSYYNGELNPMRHFPTQGSHWAWGITHRRPISSRWTWKNSVWLGQVSGDDALSTAQQQVDRNLNFNSKVYEYTTQFEFNFFHYHPFVTRDHFSPYVSTGIGFFWMNPTAVLSGNTFELRNYGTEGQTKAYSRFQFCLPLDIGIKWKFNHRVMFSLSWGYRKTFTDFLDDVSGYYPEDPAELSTISQALSNKSLDNGNANNEWGMMRGEPGNKDSYTFTMLTVLVRIGKNPNLCKFNTY